MKNKIIKPLSIVLCAVLLVSGICTGIVSAMGSSQNDEQENGTDTVKASGIKEETEAELTKDEVVYVLADADGKPKQVIVSDWINNAAGSTTISDVSELKDVKNVNGDETYTTDGNNMWVWDAQGNDIYYQGNIEKELPVTLSVSYTLDGQSISPSELAGSSGKLTIRFHYANNQYEMVEIDGKQEKIYVPFAVLTGMLLDNDVFRNVDVSNGKIINDGNRTIVVGIAFPGLQNNLNLDAQEHEIPDYVEITADVRDFELANTVTVAMNDIFSDFDTDEFDSMDDLADAMDDMTDAMDLLIDGSFQMYDGLCTLLEKSDELVDGVDELAEGSGRLQDGMVSFQDGVSQVRDGAGELVNGAGTLSGGAADLANGLGTLISNNDALNAGARQVFESLISMANGQLKEAGLTVPELTVENYAQVLDSVIASLDQDGIAALVQAEALEQVTQAVNSKEEEIRAAVTAAVEAQVTEAVTQAVRANVKEQILASGMGSVSSGDAGSAPSSPDELDKAVDAYMETPEAKQLIAAQVSGQMQSAEIQQQIGALVSAKKAELIEENMNSSVVQDQMTKALEQAASGAASLYSLKAQLDSYNQFYAGLLQYTSGVASAKAGADQLNSGAAQLHAGTNELYDGTKELYNGTAELNDGMSELHSGILTLNNSTPELIDGITELRDGAKDLYDGLLEFDEEGIQKLVDAVDGDLDGFINRFKAMVNVSKEYKSFSGIIDEMDGQVKFIYRTDAIEVD